MNPRRQRKALHNINVVPYIDVMLVLLVIFMITAPFINPSQVDLPSVSKAAAVQSAPLEVMIKADGNLLLRDRNGNDEGRPVAESVLARDVGSHHQAHPEQPVVISADKDVRYENVMRVMDTLQKLGIAHVGLLVKPAQP
jgi:biopolymer transport protein TolR